MDADRLARARTMAERAAAAHKAALADMAADLRFRRRACYAGQPARSETLLSLADEIDPEVPA